MKKCFTYVRSQNGKYSTRAIEAAVRVHISIIIEKQKSGI